MPLDIFGKVREKYPEFRSIYEEVYEMCRNVEEIMGLFSEELAEKEKMIAELNQKIKMLEKSE